MTTFHFDDAQDLSRWLVAKEYADATSVTYTRSPDGKLETRTWARLDGANPLVTTYDYYDDASEALTGELESMDYSDTVPDPDIAYTYTRLGQHHTVEDVVGTRTFAYNAYGELASETIDGTGGGLYSRVITRKHEESLAGRLGSEKGTGRKRVGKGDILLFQTTRMSPFWPPHKHPYRSGYYCGQTFRIQAHRCRNYQRRSQGPCDESA